MTEFFVVVTSLVSLAIAVYVAVDALSERRFDTRLADAGRSRMPASETARGLRKGS